MTTPQEGTRPAPPPPLGAVRRAAMAAKAVAQFVIAVKMKTALGRRITEAESEALAGRLAAQLGELRGVYTKLAQVVGAYLEATPAAATVDDGAEEEERPAKRPRTAGHPAVNPRAALGRALVRLQDGVDPMALEQLRPHLEEQWGGRVLTAVLEATPAILAAASMGQVFSGTLRECGRAVAIKAQYPGIAEATLSDLRAFELAVGALVRAIGLDAKPETVANEVRSMIGPELDYEREAAIQNAFADFWDAAAPAAEAGGCARVRVPRALVHEGLCSKTVIVQELAQGVPLATFLASSECDAAARLRVALTLVRFYHDSLYLLGLFHADPHPGNLLVAPDGSQVWFLDFGCVRAIGAESREISRITLDRTIADDREALVAAFAAHPELAGEPERARRAVVALWPAFVVHSEPFDPRLPDPADGASVFSEAWLRHCHEVLNSGVRDVAGPADMLFMHRLTHGLNCMLVAIAPPGTRAFWRDQMARYTAGPGDAETERLTALGDALRDGLGHAVLHPEIA